MSKLIEFRVNNFRGIVSLHAEPNGHSVRIRGKNGAGKSSAIDALWWALGGQLDGEVVRHGAERADVELVFGEYRITRKQATGKKPTLTVKSADGKSTFNSPTTLLAGFVEAIERRTFSTKKASEQAAILRRLCPEIDTSKLDADYARLYSQRTEFNRLAKQYGAQAIGVEIPDAPVTVEEPIDLLAIAQKKTDAERLRAANDRKRDAAFEAQRRTKKFKELIADLESRLSEARDGLASASEEEQALASEVAELVYVDTSAIDAEIAAARAENGKRAQAKQLQIAAESARSQRTKLEAQAADESHSTSLLTNQLATIQQTKSAQLASAKLPIPGLAVAGDAVTLDEGAGPVEITCLNTAARVRLDIVIAAASGHKLIAVRDASLLDDESLSKLSALAREQDVQLLTEIVANGEPLTADVMAEIEEGEVPF